MIGALVSWANDTLSGIAVAYGGRIPAEHTDVRVQPAVLFRYAGDPGRFGRGYQRYGDTRIDVRCYADTDIRAHDDVHLVVRRELEQLERVLIEGVLLHWAEPVGGGGVGVDSDTGWPFVRSLWLVLASDG